MANLALIFGANKTGTSTATAIVNADPRAHMLYEIDFAKPAHAGRNRQFVDAYPNTAHLFSSNVPTSHALSEVLRLNPSLGSRFPRVFGTKIPGLAPERFAEHADLPVIFTVRDIRSWACKNKIVRQFFNNDVSSDIMPALVRYCHVLVESFRHPRILRLRLQDLLTDGGRPWSHAIAAFLKLDAGAVENWWEKRAEIWEAGAGHTDWPAFHDSAFSRPEHADTEAVLSQHPGWGALLPIFDKYFEKPEATFSPSEISADRKALDQIKTRISMSLKEAYVSRKSWSYTAAAFVDAFSLR